MLNPTGSSRPRIVVVTRKTRYELLLERHGTASQGEFFLRSRQRPSRDRPPEQIAEEIMFGIRVEHERIQGASERAVQSIPSGWQYTRLERGELDTFLFAENDIIAVVGQDGLVANVAKYLRGHVVVGINPDPERIDGVLCQNSVDDLAPILRWIEGSTSGQWQIQDRTMVVARRDDGMELRALNEIFIGHATHQSARYQLMSPDGRARQSSSGIIVATGTGGTGWARSIVGQSRISLSLPTPTERWLAWFVREAFPSRATDAQLVSGQLLEGQELMVISEMGHQGVIFGDGIESDCMEFLEGREVTIRPAPEPLKLVVRAELVNRPRGVRSKRSQRQTN